MNYDYIDFSRTHYENIWAPIKGFEGYYISGAGEVYSEKTKRFLKPVADFNKAYSTYHRYVVMLYKDGKSYKKMIHRLVAEAFIPNPENKPQVDHIDHNTFNNRIDNLHWVTNKENCNNKKEK